MTRSYLLALCVLALTVTACENKNAQPTAQQPDSKLTTMDRDTAPAPTHDPYASDAPPPSRMQPMTGSQQQDVTGSVPPPPGGSAPKGKSGNVAHTKSAGGKTYVVQKGDTLYSISRKFYGSDSGWKKIYEANRDKISSKDKLAVGSRLTIP